MVGIIKPRQSGSAYRSNGRQKQELQNWEKEWQLNAIFTSKAFIFLPRNSGVRPTISPAINTVRIINTIMPYKPEPTPPKIISPSIRLNMVTHAGHWRKAVVHTINRTI